MGSVWALLGNTLTNHRPTVQCDQHAQCQHRLSKIAKLIRVLPVQIESHHAENEDDQKEDHDQIQHVIPHGRDQCRHDHLQTRHKRDGPQRPQRPQDPQHPQARQIAAGRVRHGLSGDEIHPGQHENEKVKEAEGVGEVGRRADVHFHQELEGVDGQEKVVQLLEAFNCGGGHCVRGGLHSQRDGIERDAEHDWAVEWPEKRHCFSFNKDYIPQRFFD